MRPGAAIVAGTVAALAVAVWHAELFTVSRPGDAPRPLTLSPTRVGVPGGLDVVLPSVPIGMRRIHSDGGVLVIHYWAAWEHNGLAQARALDSLRRTAGMEPVRMLVVCFDPYPSVARFVARHRLRLPVLLDLRHDLTHVLPCPSVPYTWVVDRAGRIAISQPGEVDWLAPGTRETLERLGAEADSGAAPFRSHAFPT